MIEYDARGHPDVCPCLHASHILITAIVTAHILGVGISKDVQTERTFQITSTVVAFCASPDAHGPRFMNSDPCEVLYEANQKQAAT
jgi:hypothetical protein